MRLAALQFAVEGVDDERQGTGHGARVAANVIVLLPSSFIVNKVILMSV